MRLIAARLLPSIAGPNKVIVDNELATRTLKPLDPPKDGHVFHVFCSEHNPGAEALLDEMGKESGIKVKMSGLAGAGLAGDTRSYTLKRLDSIKLATVQGGRKLAKVTMKYGNTLYATNDPDHLEECGHMLLYLHSQTWTRGDDVSSALAEHVAKAMDLGVHVLLAHEMNGAGQAMRFPCAFASFFSCPDGATPADLLKRGVYAEVAVALKGSEWRKASMRLLSMALAMGKEETEAALEAGGLLGNTTRVRRLVRGMSHGGSQFAALRGFKSAATSRMSTRKRSLPSTEPTYELARSASSSASVGAPVYPSVPVVSSATSATALVPEVQPDYV